VTFVTQYINNEIQSFLYTVANIYIKSKVRSAPLSR